MTIRSIWLMYHDVPREAPDPSVPRTAAMYHVPLRDFALHLSLVRASKLPVCTATESLAATRDHVVITFDDGWIGSLSHGVEALAAASLRATFYVTSEFVGRERFADRGTLRAAAEAGMEIGTHGRSHRLLGPADEASSLAELAHARAFLEDATGRPVVAGSAPGGSWSPALARAARESGHRSLSVSRPGINRRGDDPYRLRRLAVKQGTSTATIARWLRFAAGREAVRHEVLELARRALGVERYARLRRRLLGTAPAHDVLALGPEV